MSSESKNDFANIESFEEKTNYGGINAPSSKGTATYHVMVLKHGITSNHREMGYVKEALERAYDGSLEKKNSKLMVYSAKCNEKNSLDGIEAGGLRLAKEINDVLRGTATDIAREYQHRHCNGLSLNNTIKCTKIALSIMGNSMGGLYGRFALRYIDWIVPIDLGSTVVEIVIVPHIFATIATPHLGMKDMSYFKVPKFLEPLAAVIFGQSGNDLFRRSALKKEKSGSHRKNSPGVEVKGDYEEQYRYNDIIERLSLDPKFLNPLSRFSRRIAYANAFSTDIAVPTATAAFLFDDDSESSSDNGSNILDNFKPRDCASRPSESRHSSHVFVPEFDGKAKVTNNHRKYQENRNGARYSVVRFDTAATRHKIGFNRTTTIPSSTSDMARNLDSLGWSKVFIDARPHIPSIWKRPIDKWHKSRSNSFEDFIGGEIGNLEHKNEDNMSSYSSSTLKRQLSGNGFDGNTLPFGHSFLIASDRDPVHRMLYKGGRPFVDRVIAQDIIDEILIFVPPEDDGRED